MKKSSFFGLGVTACVLVLALALAACSKEDGSAVVAAAGAVADAAATMEAVEAVVDETAPASDFSYALVDAKYREFGYSDRRNALIAVSRTAYSQVPDGVVITKYTGNGGKVVIPATIEDIPVVMIGEKAFYGESINASARRITELVIPEGVELIGAYGIAHCYSLKTVTLPTSLKHLGYAAGFKSTELSTLNLPDSPSFTLGDVDPSPLELEKLPLKTRAVLDDLGAKSVELNRTGGR